MLIVVESRSCKWFYFIHLCVCGCSASCMFCLLLNSKEVCMCLFHCLAFSNFLKNSVTFSQDLHISKGEGGAEWSCICWFTPAWLPQLVGGQQRPGVRASALDRQRFLPSGTLTRKWSGGSSGSCFARRWRLQPPTLCCQTQILEIVFISGWRCCRWTVLIF